MVHSVSVVNKLGVDNQPEITAAALVGEALTKVDDGGSALMSSITFALASDFMRGEPHDFTDDVEEMPADGFGFCDAEIEHWWAVHIPAIHGT